MMITGRIANTERKNTIWPTGKRSPSQRTSTDITANTKAEPTLSRMALRRFIVAGGSLSREDGCAAIFRRREAAGRAGEVAQKIPERHRKRWETRRRTQFVQRLGPSTGGSDLM